MNVEAQVLFSEELLARGIQFQNDSFKVLRWMLIAGAVLQLIAQAEKLGVVAVSTFVVLMLVAFFLLPRWREGKIRATLAQHPWNGREVRFVFKPDYLEVHAPGGSKAIDLQ